MRTSALISALALAIGCVAQRSVPAQPAGYAVQQINGVWWLSANPREQYGVVYGVSDCMVWEAHKREYGASPSQIQEKITKFYKTHPASKELGILEVWLKVFPPTKRLPPHEGGEVWKNPHGYLNGDWWKLEADLEQIGFVRGYIWCLQTQVEEPHASYSKSPAYYRQKIEAYVTAHSNNGDEAVAQTLARFKDPANTSR